MSQLFSELTINDTTLRNRIGVSPMCQYSCENGLANAWHMVHLGSRAVGGAGLVVAEATAVVPEGRISPGCLGLWSDAHAEVLRPIVANIKANGACAGIQIAHAGRKASNALPWLGGKSLSPANGGWEIIGPSSCAFSSDHATPKEIPVPEIPKIIDGFVAAAKRADAIGIDYLEIHAAHGYLLHSFYSPLSNQRSDSYGGSFDHRIRFCLELSSAIRHVWPAKKILGIRLSCADWVDGGWTIEDSVSLSRLLKKIGIDLIDCSSGGVVPQSYPPVVVSKVPGYQVAFSEKIKKDAGILTAAVGLINDAEFAEELLNTQKADFIFIGRAFLRDPYWALNAAKLLAPQVVKSMVSPQYLRSL